MSNEVISEETKRTLQNCWVMNTNSKLDKNNLKLKEAIEEVLDKTMTSREKSEYWYKQYINQKLKQQIKELQKENEELKKGE